MHYHLHGYLIHENNDGITYSAWGGMCIHRYFGDASIVQVKSSSILLFDTPYDEIDDPLSFTCEALWEMFSYLPDWRRTEFFVDYEEPHQLKLCETGKNVSHVADSEKIIPQIQSHISQLKDVMKHLTADVTSGC